LPLSNLLELQIYSPLSVLRIVERHSDVTSRLPHVTESSDHVLPGQFKLGKELEDLIHLCLVRHVGHFHHAARFTKVVHRGLNWGRRAIHANARPQVGARERRPLAHAHHVWRHGASGRKWAPHRELVPRLERRPSHEMRRPHWVATNAAVSRHHHRRLLLVHLLLLLLGQHLLGHVEADLHVVTGDSLGCDLLVAEHRFVFAERAHTLDGGAELAEGVAHRHPSVILHDVHVLGDETNVREEVEDLPVVHRDGQSLQQHALGDDRRRRHGHCLLFHCLHRRHPFILILDGATLFSQRALRSEDLLHIRMGTLKFINIAYFFLHQFKASKSPIKAPINLFQNFTILRGPFPDTKS
jgi:hypothetical protein